MSGAPIVGTRAAVDAALMRLSDDILAVHSLIEALDILAPDEERSPPTPRDAAVRLIWVVRRMLDRVVSSQEELQQLVNRRVLPLVDDLERAQGGQLR